jgi:hypothetical protein
VGRFARFSRSPSTAAWTDSQRSFLGPTSQLRLIGRLGVFLSLAFRLDHVCSAQRPASGLSFLGLSALCQVPSSFNSTPGHPKFPCSPLTLSRIFLFACLTVAVDRRESVWLTVDVVRRSKFPRKVTWNPRL